MYERGDEVILRYRGWIGGISGAGKVRVVEDTADRTILYLPAGTGIKRNRWVNTPQEIPGAVLPREFINVDWERHDVLRIMYPGTPYSVWPMWRAGTTEQTCWYVNIEMPFERTTIGFDTQDYELDIVVEPDLSEWRWKDEDKLAALVDKGIFTAAQAKDFRRYGEGAVRRLEANSPPFNEPWPEWRPDPSWQPLKMPDDDAEWLI